MSVVINVRSRRIQRQLVNNSTLLARFHRHRNPYYSFPEKLLIEFRRISAKYRRIPLRFKGTFYYAVLLSKLDQGTFPRASWWKTVSLSAESYQELVCGSEWQAWNIQTTKPMPTRVVFLRSIYTNHMRKKYMRIISKCVCGFLAIE